MKLKNRRFLNAALVLAFCVTSLFASGERAAIQGIDRLEKRIQSVIQGLEGDVGVAVRHVESGAELSIKGETYFPMASVFKIPIFIEVLAQVKEGRFTLDDEIGIQKTDQHFGSGMLADLDAPGITLSVRNLINLMMLISDNSATDILAEKVGVANVNPRLRGYGIEDITVDRTCQHLICDAIGVDYEKFKGLTLEEAREAYRKEARQNPEAQKEASKKLSQVHKDQSTPRAMNRLLELIFHKKILDEESCGHILSVMLRCQTGEARLKGDLPPGTKVAHKTGTIGGTVNDAGIIYLPEDLGHVVITVFSKDTTATTKDVENIIARISRLAYDYFFFTASVVEPAD